MSGNQNNQQKVTEKSSVRKEKLAGYIFDMSKLIFAALVLGGLSPILLNDNDNINWLMILVGMFTTYVFAYSANRILK